MIKVTATLIINKEFELTEEEEEIINDYMAENDCDIEEAIEDLYDNEELDSLNEVDCYDVNEFKIRSIQQS